MESAVKRRLGGLTLRFARGPGRQSGFWCLNFLALALLPMVALLRPDCTGEVLGCSSQWDRILFVPRILFLPFGVLAALMAGSWVAQRRHARVEKRYFGKLEATGQKAPPGHFEVFPLDQDLIKRTLRGLALGSLLAGAGLVFLSLTPMALRACDPWRFDQPTGLAVCQSASQWTDMVVAFEVWILLGATALMALVWYTRSTSVRVDGLPRRQRRLLRFGGRSEAAKAAAADGRS